MLTAVLLAAAWLLVNELVPLGLLHGTVPFEGCPGQYHLPPRTRVRSGALVPGDGGYTVVLGPWRWVVVAAGLPAAVLPALLAHEAAHIRRGHPRRLWLLASLGLRGTRYGHAAVARWEREADEDADRALGRPGAVTEMRLALWRAAEARLAPDGAAAKFDGGDHEAQG